MLKIDKASIGYGETIFENEDGFKMISIRPGDGLGMP